MTLRRNTLIGMLALFVMYLPRHFEIAGIYSYRFMILVITAISLLSVLNGKLTITGLVRKPYYLVYLFYMCFCYLINSEVISLIGFIVDVLLLYVLLVSLICDEEELQVFIKVFLYSLIFYCLLCFVESLTGFNVWSLIGASSQNGDTRFGFVRAYGSFTTSINNGVFLALSLVLVWYGKKFTSTYQVARVANIFVWIALICTFSRAPILMACLMQVFWLWEDGLFLFLRKHLAKIIMGIFLVFLLAQIPQIESAIRTFLSMFLAIFDENVASSISDSFGNANGVGHRLYLYTWVWDALKSNGSVWIGAGPNAYFNYSWVTNQGSTHIKQSIENYYLATLYKEGILGLLSVITLFIGILHFVHVGYKRTGNMNGTISYRFLTTFLCYFIVLFTVSAVDDYRFMFVLLAIFEVGLRVNNENGIETIAREK